MTSVLRHMQRVIGSFFVLLLLCVEQENCKDFGYIVIKVCGCYSVTFLDRTLMFDWCVVR